MRVLCRQAYKLNWCKVGLFYFCLRPVCEIQGSVQYFMDLIKQKENKPTFLDPFTKVKSSWFQFNIGKLPMFFILLSDALGTGKTNQPSSKFDSRLICENKKHNREPHLVCRFFSLKV